jgi:hypothetical protein
MSDYIYLGSGFATGQSVHSSVPRFLGQGGITADSPYLPASDKYRTFRVPAPLWLPPVEVSKSLMTSEWLVELEVDIPGFPGNGTYSETIKAGTETIAQVYLGERTVFPGTNAPGWDTLKDALEHKLNRQPPPNDDDYAAFGRLAYLSFSETGLLEDTEIEWSISVVVDIKGWIPIFHASSGPTTAGPPPKWAGRAGLQEVWSFDVSALAMAFEDGEGKGRSTLINYDGGSIGTIGGYPIADDPANDEKLRMTLTHNAFFDS